MLNKEVYINRRKKLKENFRDGLILIMGNNFSKSSGIKYIPGSIVKTFPTSNFLASLKEAKPNWVDFSSPSS